MKRATKILFCIFLCLCFSCVQKKQEVEQKCETVPEQPKANELYLFFDTKVKELGYFDKICVGAKDFYLRFKQTDSNDVIFEFSYFIRNNPSFPESEYRGFLKIDSFNIAIYDEKDLMADFYKDSLHREVLPFPNYTIQGMRCVSSGWVNDGKLEILSAIEIAQSNYWLENFNKHLVYDN